MAADAIEVRCCCPGPSSKAIAKDKGMATGRALVPVTTRRLAHYEVGASNLPCDRHPRL